MTRIHLAAGVAMAALWSGVWVAAAQPPSAGGIDPRNFTGTVTQQSTDDVRLLRYTFAPAARANWHSHANGQTIIVEQGRMRVQERGGASREIGPRDTYAVAPGVVHWHGATPDGPLTQVAVSFGTTTWMQPVTDAEYAAAGRQ